MKFENDYILAGDRSIARSAMVIPTMIRIPGIWTF
jgi:hypothetical protein